MKKLLILIALFAMLCQTLFAQSLKSKGDEQYGLYNYVKASEYYQQAYKEKKDYYYAHQLGNCFRLMNNYKFAESWFAEALKYPQYSAEDQLYYAEALRNNSKYAEAKVAYKQYSIKSSMGVDAQQLWIGSCDSAVAWMQKPESYIISNYRRINSPGSDFGLVPFKDNKYVFCSDNKDYINGKSSKPFLKLDIAAEKVSKDTYGWTGRGYLTLFETSESDSSIKPLFIDVDKQTYHIGSPSFTEAGDEMFYTVTRMVKKPGNGFKNEPYTIKLEIYSRNLKSNSQWGDPVPFRFNNSLEYSVGDPFVTPNGKYLYFCSDMPGGLGGTDLYYSERALDGTWGTPQNLGGVINTPGNERFPRLTIDNTFYFSSDGRIGMGGLDIYRSKVTDKGFIRPESLKYPINSSQDDFAIYFTSNESGYFSSNREGGLGDDDIYVFAVLEEMITVKGLVLDKITKQPLVNAVVTLKNTSTGEIIKTLTDDKGNYSAKLDKNSHFDILVDKSNFIAQGGNKISSKDLTDLTWLLDPIQLNVGIRIENIYYNFDKWDLRTDAKAELNKLVKLMKENPTMEIELGSHTDSRGNDTYNLKLSQKRAQSVVNYLISNGIEKYRLTAKGYGETELVNGCANGVPCSEQEHQQNRRTEFKITRY